MMYGKLKKFRLGPAEFLKRIPSFFWHYLKSRSWLLLLIAPVLTLLALFLLTSANRILSSSPKESLLVFYDQLLHAALQDGRFEEADLYFERSRQLADDSSAATYEYATELYQVAAPDSSQKQRALSLMQSIAPRQRAAPGSTRAHLFLADYWKTAAQPSPVSKVLSLHHTSCAHPDDANSARALAEYVHSLKYTDQAIEFLKPFHQDAECQLLLSQCQLSQDEAEEAVISLDKAIVLLTSQVETHPRKRPIRIRLSQALAARGLLIRSFFALAEGLKDHPDPKLSDHLVHTYVEWLNELKSADREAQLNQIASALLPNARPKALRQLLSSTDTLTLSTGESIPQPSVIVRFHHALTGTERPWLLPILLASEELQLGHIQKATVLLRQALEHSPNHPSALNNLAWTLHQSWKQSDRQVDSPLLTEAIDLAAKALSFDNMNLAYLETRGMIAFDQENWALAERDLKQCLEANYRYSELIPIMNQIKTARSNPSSSQPSGR